MFQINQDVEVGLIVILGTYMLLHPAGRQSCSVSGQPCLTTGGGSGDQHHQDKSARVILHHSSQGNCIIVIRSMEHATSVYFQISTGARTAPHIVLRQFTCLSNFAINILKVRL